MLSLSHFSIYYFVSLLARTFPCVYKEVQIYLILKILKLYINKQSCLNYLPLDRDVPMGHLSFITKFLSVWWPPMYSSANRYLISPPH